MNPRRRITILSVFALTAGLASVLPACPSLAGTPASGGPVSCQLSWTQATGNSAYPDTSATYWTVKFPVVNGGYLSVGGTFPHARYMSFNSYQGAAAYDVAEDDTLAPDGGAPNPFIDGNPRSGTVTYQMTVAFASVPATRAPNTLYTGLATPPANEVIYRVYVPDKGQDVTGGVGTPTVTFNAPAGTKLPPQCTGATRRAGQAAPPAHPALRPAFATRPPTWVKATDNSNYGNLDNAYLSTSISQSLGQVLVIHAKAPTFPATYGGQPVSRAARSSGTGRCARTIPRPPA